MLPLIHVMTLVHKVKAKYFMYTVHPISTVYVPLFAGTVFLMVILCYSTCNIAEYMYYVNQKVVI